MKLKQNGIGNLIFLVMLMLFSVKNHAFSGHDQRVFYVAGSYTNPFLSTTLPLIGMSADDGQNWFVSKQLSGLPDSTDNLTFTASTWNGNSGIFVGSYKDKYSRQNHLFVVKNNFAQEITNLPKGFISGKLTDIACMENTCISVGHYHGSPKEYLPFSLISHNNGINWNINDLSTLHPDDFVKGKLESISCSMNNCVAIGNYLNKNNVIRPYIIRSQDNGKNWKWDGTVLTIPQTVENVALTQIKCEKGYCVATGSYTTFRQKHLSLPFLLVDDRTDSNWSFTHLNSDGFTGATEIKMNKIFCFDKTCLVSGTNRYNKTFLFSSENNGKTWIEIKDATLNSNSSSLACTKEYCIAAGSDKGSLPNYGTLVIYQSEDAGKTWTSIKNLPKYYFPFLGAMQCVDKTCVIAGASVVPQGYMRPMLMVSHDKGGSWSAIEDIFYSGDFTTLNHSH